MRHALPFLVVFLTGCVAQATSTHMLSGSTWRIVSIDGKPPVSSKAAISFEEDRLSATVGCNGMGGAWKIKQGRLIAGPMMQTEKYCAGPIWGQEQAASALLVAAPKLTLDGDRMTLRSRGHSVELVRAETPAP